MGYCRINCVKIAVTDEKNRTYVLLKITKNLTMKIQIIKEQLSREQFSPFKIKQVRNTLLMEK